MKFVPRRIERVLLIVNPASRRPADPAHDGDTGLGKKVIGSALALFVISPMRHAKGRDKLTSSEENETHCL